jgi:hypothetical protein
MIPAGKAVEAQIGVVNVVARGLLGRLDLDR